MSASPAALRIGFYLPVDAMVEFYFENWDAFNCFYASEEFKRLSAHGAGFIGSIDTYLVQSHTVVEHPSDGGYWLKRFCDSVRGHKEKAGLVPAFCDPPPWTKNDSLRSRGAQRSPRIMGSPCSSRCSTSPSLLEGVI
ncbi:EthD domain-containing protein [uncultured Ellagibacter sp.]|uniref:EthD domain-containing protein n=1 Tax=uncultured Ellagibacter sp. TaxID=2137580 RepID=UPI002612EEBC|nr:EthD domain-containing protein [uncultured Ellagibacter sp.]